VTARRRGRLEVLHAGWDPPLGEAGTGDLLKAARAALRDASGSPARAVRNRVTAGRMQVRLGRGLLWYPYARSDGDWEPVGPPSPDAAAAGALAARPAGAPVDVTATSARRCNSAPTVRGRTSRSGLAVLSLLSLRSV
jgi:hypothetical protein